MLDNNNLFILCKEALMCCDIDKKIELTNKLYEENNSKKFNYEKIEVVRIEQPGRPEKPLLVLPKEVPRRRLGTLEGRLALYHAIAHIEFNAINLALDAVYRFQDMPIEYYDDWLKVAKEEAYHFNLMRNILKFNNIDYGSYKSHNGLWEMALATDDSPLARMALVPRLLEARGLDVTPRIIDNLKKVNAIDAIEALEIIVHDEIGHVAIGNNWYNYLCGKESLDPIVVFEKLLKEHAPTFVRKPFSYDLRRKAGFSEKELEALENIAI